MWPIRLFRQKKQERQKINEGQKNDEPHAPQLESGSVASRHSPLALLDDDILNSQPDWQGLPPELLQEVGNDQEVLKLSVI